MVIHTCTYNVYCVLRLQEERMAVIKGMLKQREADHQALNDRRLEHLWFVNNQSSVWLCRLVSLNLLLYIHKHLQFPAIVIAYPKYTV